MVGRRRRSPARSDRLIERSEEGRPTTHTKHLIGLLLGAEEDWPRAFEELLGRLGPIRTPDGTRHEVSAQRLTIEPFDLRQEVRHDLVIDRLAYWYYHPREWLKKAALVNGTYLLNSPFTFQSMEKHSAYCAMLRLGLKVPQTVLVPYKHPVDNSRWAYTAAKYNRAFDLDAIAEHIGYPLFMKPFDGGGWRGVSRVRNRDELHRAYDDSGEMLMHLQQSIEGYDVFARSLTIGAETMVMHFRPDLPMHDRYAVDHDFLSPETGAEVLAIARLINAFFRWEFNSCEVLVRGTDVHPIDYANACPDIAVTSLHYYFPWAISALLKWSIFCTVTGRRPRLDLETAKYFEIADSDRTYEEKLSAYAVLSEAYFQTDAYNEFCADALPDIDDVVREWVGSAQFDALLADTVRATYPQAEQDRFLAHFRGLLEMWRTDQRPDTSKGVSIA